MKLLMQKINWGTKTAKHGLISFFFIGYFLTIIGLTIEDMIHGISIVKSISDLHHHVFPILLGFTISFFGYSLGHETEKKKKKSILLNTAKEKYKTLTNNVNIGIFRTTLKGEIIETNLAISKLFQYDRKELSTIKSANLYADPDNRKEIVKKININGFIKNEVLQFRRKDGSVFTGSLTINGIKDQNNIIKYFDGIIEDITEQHLAENKLKNTLDTLIKTQKIAGIGSYVYDILNDDWSSQKSIVLDDIFGIDDSYKKDAGGWVGIVYVEDQEMMGSYLANDILKEGREFDKEYRIKRINDDEIRWVHGRGELIRNDAGEIIKMIGTIQDITERKISEIQIEKFRQVTEQSPSVYELYNMDGLQIEVNKAYETLWGFPDGREQTVGKFNVLESKEVEDTGLMVYIKKAFAGEIVTLPPYKFDPRGRTEADGVGRARWLNTKIYPLKGVNGKVTNIVITHEDISDKMYAEVENTKLQEQLAQSQKMEAIGTLAGGIAHDFNNILGIIIGYTELTMEDITDTSETLTNMQHVLKASIRAKDMVHQILAFSRKSTQAMEYVNIGKIIKETIGFLRSTIPTTIEIKHKIEKNLGLIFGNATQINQVIMNLCTNASHAMKDSGGVLEIILKKTILDGDDSIRIEIEPGEYQHLIVSDNGCGMEKSILERIFEPYFTTKKDGEGTGMGLAVIYGIVKSHRGDIKVYSEPGKGTVVNIYFPILETEKTEEISPELYDDVQGNNECILFVDDEKHLVDLGTIMLKKLGYKVESRCSSLETLEEFKANPDKYDLVITDMTMPNMTGIKLAAEIHKIKKTMPVILCTGFSNGINKNNFQSHGISSLIMKPIVRKEMANAIKNVLGK